jgi:hypothetical protein
VKTKADSYLEYLVRKGIIKAPPQINQIRLVPDYDEAIIHEGILYVGGILMSDVSLEKIYIHEVVELLTNSHDFADELEKQFLINISQGEIVWATDLDGVLVFGKGELLAVPMANTINRWAKSTGPIVVITARDITSPQVMSIVNAVQPKILIEFSFIPMRGPYFGTFL